MTRRTPSPKILKITSSRGREDEKKKGATLQLGDRDFYNTAILRLLSHLNFSSPSFLYRIQNLLTTFAIMPSLTITDTLPLPNSTVRIPRLGFGVYQSPASICFTSCTTALNASYKHIDTAQFYGNELQVGQAVAKSGIPRSEIFVTTKILSAGGSVEKSYKKCLESIQKIDPARDGYVDLFLIHSPNAGSAKRKEMWQALEKLYEKGKVKSIGVSNFGVAQIDEMKEYAKIWPPHVNQIEVCITTD